MREDMIPSPTHPAPHRPRVTLPDEPRGIVLFVIAICIYFAGRAPFLGQWDSFDYLRQTVTHQLSALAFGRPVFIGCNIVLWEVSRSLFGLAPVQVEKVVASGIILTGGLGVLLFRRLARHLLPGRAGRMATLAFLLSPMYAVYAGSVMTEVPMLVVLLAAALLLWELTDDHPVAGPLAGGILFGLAVGIREQAATLGAVFLWILWEQRPDWASRVRACLLFLASAGVTVLGPILALYFHDPAGFFVRTEAWMRAIPMGGSHLLKNVESSLLFALAVCPGAWLALLGGGVVFGVGRALRGRRRGQSSPPRATEHRQYEARKARFAHPVWGLVCGFVLPLAVLWRDADVQMHPRYLLILLPAGLLGAAFIYGRLLDSTRAVIWWAVIQVVVFGGSAVALEPLRQIQYEKKEFAELVVKAVPGGGLLIPGGFSPILEYYRDIGIRPAWRILWSGWGWNRTNVEAAIEKSWEEAEPVYLCDPPWGWLMLEDERLDLFYILRDSPRATIAPGITRVFPPRIP